MRPFLEPGSKLKPLWLDYSAYAGRLLAGGDPPWLDAANLLGWQRKSQGLLKSDVVAFPVAPFIAAWIPQHAALQKQMADRRRPLFPLKTLLADEALRTYLGEVLAGFRGSFVAAPLALTVPSPRCWITLAYAQAFGLDSRIEIGADEVDSAAVFVADFLRSFGSIGFDVLLLDESLETEPASTAEVDWYRPVFNVADYFRWNVGLRLTAAASDPGIVEGLGFVIAPRKLATLTGIAMPSSFWTDAEARPSANAAFRYAEIPADANPERVLERLDVLRKSVT